MIADETADDDYDGSEDEHIICPRLYFRHTQSCSNSQNNKADD